MPQMQNGWQQSDILSLHNSSKVDGPARTLVSPWPDVRRNRCGGHVACVATSSTALANASGASCGKLWPMPSVMSRCEYLPENFRAYADGSACGAPLASPSRVIV